MERKITQISTIPAGGGYTSGVLALAEDGSLWLSSKKLDGDTFGAWSRFKALPVPSGERDVPIHGLDDLDSPNGKEQRAKAVAEARLLLIWGAVCIMFGWAVGHFWP